jgi:hypothetical protein
VAICKTCGKKYSKWATPVSARGVCGECFEAELSHEAEVEEQRQQDLPPAPTILERPPRKSMLPIRLRSFLPRGRSKIVFALVMGCYCFVVGSFVSTWAGVAGVRRPPRSFYLTGGAADIFGALVFAPIIESLMLVAVFEGLRRVRAPDWVQVFASALFISELHVWPWWPHATIVLPSFLIQAASYLYWRRTSWKDAFWVLVSIHALNNVIPTLSAVGRAMRHA